MFRPLFWVIIRSQLNLRKLYSVIYKINFIYLKFNETSLNLSALILGHYQVITEFEETVQCNL